MRRSGSRDQAPLRSGLRATMIAPARREVLGGLAGMAVALAGAGVARSAAAQTEDPRPLLAVAVPISGEHAVLGERVVRLVALALERVATVRTSTYDTAAGGARAAVEAAIADGAVAVLGPIGEAECREAVEAVRATPVPLFLLSGSTEHDGSLPHLFRLRTGPAEQARALAGAVFSGSEIRTVAILSPDDAYGTDATTGFVAAFSEVGGAVIRIARYEEDSRRLGRAVDELMGERQRRLEGADDAWSNAPGVELRSPRRRSARPGAVFIPDYADRVAELLPFLQVQGWLDPSTGEGVGLLGLSGWAGYELEAVGALAAGAWVTLIYHPDDVATEANEFRLLHEERFSGVPTEFDAQAYDAAVWLATLLAGLRRDGRSVADVVSRAESMEPRDGACGRMWLGEEHGVVRELQLWQVDGGGTLFPVGRVVPRAGGGGP